MAQVFNAFYRRLDNISKGVHEISEKVKTHKNYCCRHVMDLSAYIKGVDKISSSVMTISSILDLSESEQTCDIISECKILLEKIQETCKVAYIKDECEGFKRVALSRDMEPCISKYSKHCVSGVYMLEGSDLIVEIADSISGLEILYLDKEGGMDGSSKDDCNGD